MRRVTWVLLVHLFLMASAAAAAQDTATPPPGMVIIITPTPEHSPTLTPTTTETPPGWDIVLFSTVQYTDGDDIHAQRVAFRYEVTAGEAITALLLALLLVVKLTEVLMNVWQANTREDKK